MHDSLGAELECQLDARVGEIAEVDDRIPVDFWMRRSSAKLSLRTMVAFHPGRGLRRCCGDAADDASAAGSTAASAGSAGGVRAGRATGRSITSPHAREDDFDPAVSAAAARRRWTTKSSIALRVDGNHVRQVGHGVADEVAHRKGTGQRELLVDLVGTDAVGATGDDDAVGLARQAQRSAKRLPRLRREGSGPEREGQQDVRVRGSARGARRNAAAAGWGTAMARPPRGSDSMAGQVRPWQQPAVRCGTGRVLGVSVGTGRGPRTRRSGVLAEAQLHDAKRRGRAGAVAVCAWPRRAWREDTTRWTATSATAKPHATTIRVRRRFMEDPAQRMSGAWTGVATGRTGDRLGAAGLRAMTGN